MSSHLTRHILLQLAAISMLVFGGPVQPLSAARLTVRNRPEPTLANAGVIVGRATCRDSTWLLTDSRLLVHFSLHASHVAVSPLRGLRANDRPWGIACLEDGTLWTLVSPRTVARITAEGAVRDAVSLPTASVSLFGAGDRLLVQPMPAAAGRPLLAATARTGRAPLAPWAGLVARITRSPNGQALANLATCGLGAGAFIPCWFADDRRVTISDGAASTTTPIVADNTTTGVDSMLPIWDVSLAGRDRIWILRTSPTTSLGHRVGGSLSFGRWSAPGTYSIDLDPPARLILSADDRSCILLSAAGGLEEVTWE